MSRLTKSDIETLLLSGASVPWQDANKKTNELQLSDAKQRRLFSFLLTSKVRKPTELPSEFITGLSTAFDASDDPATIAKATTAANTTSGPWCLQSIETLGFGGLNTWNGSKFHFDFDKESLLLEGANGCGKSSLIGAILWALMGERPRDQTETEATEPQPVFSKSTKPVGEWPPVACYPPSVAELKSSPFVSVQLVLENPAGTTAKIERSLSGGIVTAKFDAHFSVPQVILEAGLLMPARLARLRFDDGGGRLTDAVQKLTGLDDLIEIGALTEGLCHKTREYRGYKSKELAVHRREFDHAIEQARAVLAPVQVTVPSFVLSDTDDKSGTMAALGKMLSDRATELAQVVSSDLAETLKLSSTQVQNQVIAAIAAAENDLKRGVQGTEIWKTLESISKALDSEASARLTAVIAAARSSSTEAVELLKKSAADSKFQLKAVAAQWHLAHASGAIENCPLCEHDLKSQPSLVEELETLRAAGDAAAKTFDDNINAIKAKIEASLPASLRRIGSEILKIEPSAKLVLDIRTDFILQDRYANCLVKFAALVEEALKSTPTEALDVPAHVAGEDVLNGINEQIAVAERLLGLSAWFNKNASEWLAWWQQLAAGAAVEEVRTVEGEAKLATTQRLERLVDHLSRLSGALAKAEPFRKAAEAMRTAWKEGMAAAVLEKEVAKRDAIAEALMPLKLLGPLCEAVARAAIEDLSGRISALLERILLTEQLQFRGTQLDRKEGLVVRGGFAPDLHIDATLVANTSWLRAVLWCFLFALREEAVEQLGNDPFPVMIFDDPQATFDVFHRARWAHYVAALQTGPAKLQVLIATYEESFLDLIKADGIQGREAFLTAPGPGCDHVAILEGASLDRAWDKAKVDKTPQAAVDYLIKVRVHLEGMLKIMLRGEDTAVPKMLLGQLREFLGVMHSKAKTPWDRPVFKPLLAALEKGRPEVKYIEGAHHTTGQSYGMGEAELVEKLLRGTIGPTLNRAFKTAREHKLLHGGMKALYAIPPTASLPEGYQAKVRGIPLKVLR